MEFQEVVNHRKMIRSFEPKPIPEEKLNRILKNAFKGPSAGFSQGIEFLVLLRPEDREIFFNCIEDRQPLQENAQVILIPLAHKQTYLDRYAEPDKGWDDKSESRWPVPFWITDTAMASLLVLLTVVDEDLGAVFIGLTNEQCVRKNFTIPNDYKPIGAILIGYPAPHDTPSPSLKRGRRTKEKILHYNRFGNHLQPDN